MSATPSYDIEIVQGATFEITFVYKDGAGAAVDLSDYTARMQVREGIGGKVMADLSHIAGIALGADGGVGVTINAATTRAMTPTSGDRIALFDLFLSAPSGKVVRLVEGAARVRAAVTRPQA